MALISVSENIKNLVHGDHTALHWVCTLPFGTHYFSNAMDLSPPPPVFSYAVFSVLNALSSYGNPTYSSRSSSNAISMGKHFLITLPELIISFLDTFYLTYIY